MKDEQFKEMLLELKDLNKKINEMNSIMSRELREIKVRLNEFLSK